MSKINQEKVMQTIQRALNLSAGALTINSSTNDLEQWDSLGHLSILTALDKLFDGKVASLKEMAAADSVGKILQVLDKNSLI